LAAGCSPGGRAPGARRPHPNDPLAQVSYFILLAWIEDRLVEIRDFRYARYVAEDAEIIIAAPA
jgi:hypothetical protein